MSLSETALPFDDIRNLVKSMPGPDEDALARVKARDAELTKPAGSLGRLEEIAEWLAAWSGKAPPKITVKKKERGGLNLSTSCKLTHLDEDSIAVILKE